MKKLFLLLFCVMLCFTNCSEKGGTLASGRIGMHTWILSDDGMLTIDGIGEMPDYQVEPTENLPPWLEFRNDITGVIIGNDVSKIGDYVFFRCGNLASVTFGNAVTAIGNNAFSGCSSLTSVTIPNSITEIKIGIFYECSGLKSVSIPNSLIRIRDYAFFDCTSLTEITNHRGAPQIVGEQAFGEIDKDNCTLFVPVGSENAYRVANGWTDFVNIRAIQ